MSYQQSIFIGIATGTNPIPPMILQDSSIWILVLNKKITLALIVNYFHIKLIKTYKITLTLLVLDHVARVVLNVNVDVKNCAEASLGPTQLELGLGQVFDNF